MNRQVLVLGLLIVSAGSAFAQPGGAPALQPPVSPYLNLLRPGNSAGFNYYGLVRPQFQTQNDIMGLQQQTNANRAAITDLNGVLVPTTGHATTFMNTFGYYPIKPSAGNMRAGAGAGARPSSTGQTSGSSSTPTQAAPRQ